MPTCLIHPPASGPLQTLQAFGRTFASTPGTPILVNDGESAVLAANGWLIAELGGGGATANRPAAPRTGLKYADTTLGIVVMWDGATWRNAVTGAAA